MEGKKVEIESHKFEIRHGTKKLRARFWWALKRSELEGLDVSEPWAVSSANCIYEWLHIVIFQIQCQGSLECHISFYEWRY